MKKTIVYEIIECLCSEYVSIIRINKDYSTYKIGAYRTLSDCIEAIKTDFKANFDNKYNYYVKCDCYASLQYLIKDISREALNEEN